MASALNAYGNRCLCLWVSKSLNAAPAAAAVAAAAETKGHHLRKFVNCPLTFCITFFTCINDLHAFI